jgi:hypothetical protein
MSDVLSRSAPGVVLLAMLAGLVLATTVVLAVAVEPAAGPVLSALALVAALAWSLRRTVVRPLAVGVGLVVLLVLAVAVAVEPLGAAAVAVAAMVLAGWEAARRTVVPVLAIAAAVIGLGTLAVTTSAWPATTGLAAVAVAIVVLAVRVPALGLAAAVLFAGFEGSAKVLLGLEPVSYGLTNRSAGAAVIDLALFAAVAGVLVADRVRTPRALWARMSRGERVAVSLVAAWLGISVLQIAQGDLRDGVLGFRLFQAYVLVGVAAAALAARPVLTAAATRAVLAVGVAVAGYAAFRVLVGPADAEVVYALSFRSATQYGDDVRAVGSFSGATGLSSYLTPLIVFSAVTAFLVRRLRVQSCAVVALGLVALVASYGRGPLVAVAAGLLLAVAFVVIAGDLPPRRKLLAAGSAVVVLGASFGGLFLVSVSSPVLRERAEGLVDPSGDESLQIRFASWENAVDLVREEPLGRGLGSVGAVTDDQPDKYLVTDNSFLKVLVEQGVVVGALFVAGLLGLMAAVLRRLRRRPPGARALGLAALAGFAAFLALSATGEYVEQPGKVVAWALAGIAVAQAFGRDAAPGGRAGEGVA